MLALTLSLSSSSLGNILLSKVEEQASSLLLTLLADMKKFKIPKVEYALGTLFENMKSIEIPKFESVLFSLLLLLLPANAHDINATVTWGIGCSYEHYKNNNDNNCIAISYKGRIVVVSITNLNEPKEKCNDYKIPYGTCNN